MKALWPLDPGWSQPDNKVVSVQQSCIPQTARDMARGGGRLSAATCQSCQCSQEIHKGEGGKAGMRVLVTFFMTRLSPP